jgi:hypothetical protein
MKEVRNTVGRVKFTFPMMVCSVLVAVWHYECHPPEELACSILQYYLQLMTKQSMPISILSLNIDELRLVLRFYLLSLERLTIPQALCFVDFLLYNFCLHSD